MERDSLSRRDFIRNGIVAIGVAAGATLASSPVGAGLSMISDPEEPSFEPVVLPKDIVLGPPVPPSIKRENRARERQDQIAKEMARIKRLMQANPNLFNEKKLADFSMYYPIYRPIADKFQIDWYLIFIVHEAETGASAGKRGFEESSYYKGAMQLDPEFWPEQYIKDAAKGLSYLAKLEQRHPDDWSNIAAGARILADNFHENKYLTKDKAVLHALRRYSSQEQADRRFKTYLKYEGLFSPKKKAIASRQALMVS